MGGTTIVTANALDNTGTIDIQSGTLGVSGNISGSGQIDIGNNVTLELHGTSSNPVLFEGTTGTLQIDSSGTSSPFSIVGNGSAISATDIIDLPNISYDPSADSYSSDVITVSDGTGTVTIDVIGGVGSNTFTFVSDGHGGTEIYDPPATSPGSSGLSTLSSSTGRTGSVSIGGNDTFVFHPGMGAETIKSNPQDIIELDGFANVQNLQQLASDITSNAHGDALIELGHNDSITVAGMTAAQLQAHLQSFVHLH
jgi:hypothetical protein